MARLVQRTDHGDVVHELLFQRMAIGRGTLNDIRIGDPGERRVHAVVEAVGQGSYVVRDNRSRTGLKANGERVTDRHELAHGDILEVGGATFVFDAAAGEAAPAAPPAPTLGGGILRLTTGTLVSRLFGLVREQVAFAYFGARKLDAYNVASNLSNLFRDVLGEYAAENAFMPTHKTLEAQGRSAEARRLFGTVLRVVAVAGIAVVILGVVFAPWIIAGFVPGFQSSFVSAATSMARWMMPSLLLIAVASVYGSLLLAERRFVLYSLAPIATSVCVVGSIVVAKSALDVGALAAGIVAGALVQAVVCALPYLGRRAPAGPPPSDMVTRAALRKVGRSAIPVVAAGLLNKVSVLTDQFLCSLFCGRGRISALTGAARLLQLPVGIFGLSVGRAAFPRLIEEAAAREGDGFSRAVVRALRWNLFLMLPVSLGMVCFARPFVRLVYQHGECTEEEAHWIALALACYCLGLVGMGARMVLSRAFYALLNTQTPLYASAAAVALNVGLAVLLVRTPLGHGGLALATASAAWFQSTLLLLLLHGELARQGRRLKLAGLWGGLARMALCGAAMAACVWGCELLLGRLWAGRGMVATVASVAAPGAAGLLAYVGMALVLNCDEVRFLRRFGRVDRARL